MVLQCFGLCDRAEIDACGDFLVIVLRRSAKDSFKTTFSVRGSKLGGPEMAFLSSDMAFWSHWGADMSIKISGGCFPAKFAIAVILCNPPMVLQDF